MAETLSLIDYPDGMLADVPLWSGVITWAHDEDVLKGIDVPAIPLLEEESAYLLCRNGSSIVDVNLSIGQIITPALCTDYKTKVWSLVGVAATDVFTSVAHGLKTGDALECVTAGATGCTVGVTYYVRGATHDAQPTADTLMLSVSRGSATTVNCSDVTPGTFKLASEFFANVTHQIPKWVAASSTAVVAGLNTKAVPQWGKYGGHIKAAKSAVTADVFSIYLEVRKA